MLMLIHIICFFLKAAVKTQDTRTTNACTNTHKHKHKLTHTVNHRLYSICQKGAECQSHTFWCRHSTSQVKHEPGRMGPAPGALALKICPASQGERGGGCTQAPQPPTGNPDPLNKYQPSSSELSNYHLL